MLQAENKYEAKRKSLRKRGILWDLQIGQYF